MIKVNLLKSRAVANPLANASIAGGGAISTSQPVNLNLGKEFSTFEYSIAGQVLKILLLFCFVAPLLMFEKMRGSEGRDQVDVKIQEFDSLELIRLEKQEEVKKYVGVEEQRRIHKLRDVEITGIKQKRLLALKGLDAVQTIMPVDVWLNSISYKGSGQIEIQGQTLMDSGLDTMVKNLKKVKGFSKVNVLKDVKVKAENGRTINDFQIGLFVSNAVDVESDEIEGL